MRIIICILFCSLLLPGKIHPLRKSEPKGDLKRKKILITAPANYSKRFARIVRDANGIPVVMPAIETVINPDASGVDNILDNPDQYDWVVLPSRKAIDAFFLRVQDRKIPLAKLQRINFSAIGRDIDYMKDEYGQDVALIPEEASPKGIVDALSELVNVENHTIAVVAPKVVNLTEPDVIPDFIRDLKKLGMSVEKVEGYITRPANTEKYSQEIKLVREKKIDVIAFTSTAEIEALIQMAGSVEILNKNPVACFGPYTAANAKKLGVEVDYTGQNFHSFNDYVRGLANYLK